MSCNNGKWALVVTPFQFVGGATRGTTWHSCVNLTRTHVKKADLSASRARAQAPELTTVLSAEPVKGNSMKLIAAFAFLFLSALLVSTTLKFCDLGTGQAHAPGGTHARSGGKVGDCEV